MSEPEKTVRPATVRRGLPLRTVDEAVGSKPGTSVAAVPALEPVVPSRKETGSGPAVRIRRAGLPRGSEPSRSHTSDGSEPRGPLRAGEAETPTGTSTFGRRPGLPRTRGVPPSCAAEHIAAIVLEAPPAASATATVVQLPAHEPMRSPRRPRSRAGRIVAVGLGMLLIATGAVIAARWFVSLYFMKEFLIRYPGETHLPSSAPVGFPAWLGWQHFLNAFFIVLIIRTGWQVRTQERPPAMWVRNSRGRSKSKNPPQKISLTLWAHLTIDALWLVNGLVFVIVLFATGQWMRVVPTSWEIFPNAISAALQYVSLNWPAENGWINYNSLQVLAYFTTIFVAAPLAALTGIRMSNAWPAKAALVNRLYPVELARAVHLPVMLYFVLFVIAHVALVLATGARRNLNHMYAAQDSGSWAGFWIFFASLLVMAGAAAAARPLVLGAIAQLTGKVSRR